MQDRPTPTSTPRRAEQSTWSPALRNKPLKITRLHRHSQIMKCTHDGGRPAAPFKPKLRKGLWSPDEDQKLFDCIMSNGLLGYSWSNVAKQAGLQRCGKSCRLRWINYLRPGIKRGEFSRQEEQLIIHLQSKLGNRWSQIAASLPGRTDNEIKNYWNSHIKNNKRLIKLKHRQYSHSSSTDTESNTLPDRIDINSVTPTITYDVVSPKENQNQFLVDWDFSNNNLMWDNANLSISESHASITPGDLEAQCLLISETAKLSACDELIIESWRTALPHREVPVSVDCSLDSTGITMPASVDSNQSSIEEFEIDGDLFINENVILFDHSSFTDASPGITEWNATHSYSNIAADFFYVLDDHERLGISIEEDFMSLRHHEKTTYTHHHKSYDPFNSAFGSQFSSPTTIWAADHSNHIVQPEDDWKDRLKLRYEVNFGVLTNNNMNCRHDFCNQFHGGGVGDELRCSSIPNEEANTNWNIPTVLFEGLSRNSCSTSIRSSRRDYNNLG